MQEVDVAQKLKLIYWVINVLIVCFDPWSLRWDKHSQSSYEQWTNVHNLYSRRPHDAARAIFVTKTKTKTRIITLRSMSTKTRIMTSCENDIKIKITASRTNENENYHERKNSTNCHFILETEVDCLQLADSNCRGFCMRTSITGLCRAYFFCVWHSL